MATSNQSQVITTFQLLPRLKKLFDICTLYDKQPDVYKRMPYQDYYFGEWGWTHHHLTTNILSSRLIQSEANTDISLITRDKTPGVKSVDYTVPLKNNACSIS